MAKDTEILTALLELKEDIGGMKGGITTLLKHKSDQEKRIRKLEANSAKKQGALALFVFILGSAAGWLGIRFGE